MQKKITPFLLLLLIATFLFSQPLVAADALSYDPYAADSQPSQTSSSERFWQNVLKVPVFPFWLIKYPVDKTLVFVEKKHIHKKAIWIYNQMQNRGVTPHFSLVSLNHRSYGAEFDFVRLVRQKHNFPDLILQSWIRYSEDVYFQTGAKAGWSRIGDTRLSAFGIFEYEDRYNEHFYGIGPHSSRGDGYVYGMETTTIQPVIQYDWSHELRSEFFASYRNINMDGGKDGGRGQIGEGIFNERDVYGLSGDSLFSLGTRWTHDTRNQKENSTKGGLRAFEFGYHEGLGSSQARYFRYMTDFRQYFRLGSDRRVLAFRFLGEHHDEINGGDIPFHQLSKLGGYGAFPRLSHTLRGFNYNRFTDESALLFNVEYRYNIWEYRHYKMDTVFFWDEGQVFGEFSELQLKNFRESYGIGFRVSAANIPLLSIELAHGDEGTNIYVKTKTPF